jgi:hypothetical protein
VDEAAGCERKEGGRRREPDVGISIGASHRWISSNTTSPSPNGKGAVTGNTDAWTHLAARLSWRSRALDPQLCSRQLSLGLPSNLLGDLCDHPFTKHKRHHAALRIVNQITKLIGALQKT